MLRINFHHRRVIELDLIFCIPITISMVTLRENKKDKVRNVPRPSFT